MATLATGAMLTVAALPFVALFPQPPDFGRGTTAIVAAFAVLATIGTSFRAGGARRIGILRGAAMVFGITAASIGIRILVGVYLKNDPPTFDMLPWLFRLQGEDIDDAVLYEGWLEVWLACALVVLLVTWFRRPAAHLVARLAPEPPAPAWTATTVLLWLVGWAMLAGAVLEGRRTDDFLRGAIHVTGEIADKSPHPLIRFTAFDGTQVTVTQNGSVSRKLGAAIAVAYHSDDPGGTARAATFWALWTDVLSLAWIGLCLTLHPFFGFRACFRRGR